VSTELTFAVDLTPLIADPNLNVLAFTQDLIQRFADEVTGRIKSLRKEPI